MISISVIVRDSHLVLSYASGTSLLICDLHIHAVVLLDLIFTFMVVYMSLKSTARSVHSVNCSTLSSHTRLPSAVDLLAFNDREILAVIHRSVRMIVATRIDIESVVQTLSDFPYPCLSDVRH